MRSLQNIKDATTTTWKNQQSTVSPMQSARQSPHFYYLFLRVLREQLPEISLDEDPRDLHPHILENQRLRCLSKFVVDFLSLSAHSNL